MKRPAIITIICVLGYISVLFAFPRVFSPPVKKLGLFMPALFGVIVAAQFISYVGLWYFKRWGVELFVTCFIVKTLFYLLTDQTGPLFYAGVVLSVIFIVLQLRHYRQMSAEL
jgi:hypothetical protein